MTTRHRFDIGDLEGLEDALLENPLTAKDQLFHAEQSRVDAERRDRVANQHTSRIYQRLFDLHLARRLDKGLHRPSTKQPKSSGDSTMQRNVAPECED